MIIQLNTITCFVPDTMLDSNTSQILVTAFHKIKDFDMRKVEDNLTFVDYVSPYILFVYFFTDSGLIMHNFPTNFILTCREDVDKVLTQ